MSRAHSRMKFLRSLPRSRLWRTSARQRLAPVNEGEASAISYDRNRYRQACLPGLRCVAGWEGSLAEAST